MPASASRGPFLAVLLVLAGLLLAAPAASAQPASAPSASAEASKAKACKRKKGESKKRWLKRCKCTRLKRGETRRKFRKRCPGAKVPRSKAPSSPGGENTAPGGPAPAAQPLTGQAAIDFVATMMRGMRASRVACSGSTCASSITEHIDFCQDGVSFQGRRTTEGYSGAVYEVNFAGTYRILEAQVNAERTLAEARVDSQVTQATGNDDPPPSGQGVLTFVGSNQVYLNRQTEYTRGQGQC